MTRTDLPTPPTPQTPEAVLAAVAELLAQAVEEGVIPERGFVVAALSRQPEVVLRGRRAGA